jgi:drug/metabolite transporter (DMT)-like permease
VRDIEGENAAPPPLWLKAAPVIFLLLWSGGFAFAKIGLEHTTPLTFLTLRYWFALAVIAPVLALMRPPLPRRASQWAHLAFVGFLIQVLYFGLSYFGFWLGVSAGALALIVSLQPVLVGLAAPAVTRERVSVQQWLGLILGLAGAAAVILARAQVEIVSPLGIACAVGALFGMTLAALWEKRFGLHHHPVASNAVQYLVGFVAIAPFAFLIEGASIDWTMEFLMALAYLVIANSLIAVSLLLAMIRYGQTARVSALLFLVPPMAALIAWGLIGEEMPLMAWAGMGLAALGVLLATRQPRARKRQHRPDAEAELI